MAAHPAEAGQQGEMGQRHEVYTRFLQLLTLTQVHRDRLRSPRRGFDDEMIEHVGFRTLPKDATRRCEITEELAGSLELGSVPGFFELPDDEWSLSGRAGILLPVKNACGLIVALQIIADNGPKYCWLSSNGKPSGASPGAPAHVATPTSAPGHSIRIVEGPLKAEILAPRTGWTTIGLPGVAGWKSAGTLDYVEYLAGRDALAVHLAFDQDHEPVKRGHALAAARALADELATFNHEVRIDEW